MKLSQLLVLVYLNPKKRAARMGRNPKTGEAIQIKASVNPKFRPAKAFKDAVNS